MANIKKFLDGDGIQHLWKQLSMEDYPNNETLIAVINAIDESKADKNELNNYLTKEEYIAGETGGTVNLSLLLEAVYPVGAVYMSMSNIEPSVLFGFGTWQKIEDTFLLASGPKYTLGSTGGEETHTLTVDEMPNHGHNFYRHQLWRNEEDSVASDIDAGYGASNKTLDIYLDDTSLAGGDQSHNNMPPYLTINMWQRIE